MPCPSDFILTKILATVGPACNDPAMLSRMFEEGVRVVRINFSHGTLEDFSNLLHAVREAAHRTQLPVAVLGDLSGPKIRLGPVEGGRLELHAGDGVEFTPAHQMCRRLAASERCVLSTTYPPLVAEVQPGQRVLIDDGNVRLLAVERGFAEQTATDDVDEERDGTQQRLHCRVTQGGPISSRKGVNLPDTALSLPSLTAWDHRCARWAVEQGLDYLALSFVRRAEDLHQLGTLLKEVVGLEGAGGTGGATPPVVAKIEKPRAVEDLDAICDAGDAVMVARGDLGVEMDLARVPLIQKRIIKRAHAHGKPVIVATQMLESMVERPTPTRAEVSDVANAIIDGADAVMLSGETAVGRYPVQAVGTMARVAAQAEPYAADLHRGQGAPPTAVHESRYRTAALAHGVSTAAADLGARYVVVWSQMGGGARYLSQNRLATPIIALSSSDAALRRMNLMFGVTPIAMRCPRDAEELLPRLDALLLDNAWAKPGDPVVVVMGQPLGTPAVTNEMRIHYIGDVCPLPRDAAERPLRTNDSSA